MFTIFGIIFKYSLFIDFQYVQYFYQNIKSYYYLPGILIEKFLPDVQNFVSCMKNFKKHAPVGRGVL